MEMVTAEEFKCIEQRRDSTNKARQLLARLAEQDRVKQFVPPNLYPEAARIAEITGVNSWELSAAFHDLEQPLPPKPKKLSDQELAEIMERRGDQRQTTRVGGLPAEEARLVRDWAQARHDVERDPQAIAHELEELKVQRWLKPHVSPFESHSAAARMLERLEAAMRAALAYRRKRAN